MNYDKTQNNLYLHMPQLNVTKSHRCKGTCITKYDVHM